MITAKIQTLAAAILLSTSLPMTARAESRGDVHSLTGSGLLVVPANFFFPGSPGFAGRSSVSAHQKADGTVEGTAILQLWFDSQAEPIVLTQDITCLTVTGDTAYFGAVVRHSNDLSYAKPGDQEVGFVTDTRGDGPDISWVGPAVFFLAPGEDCTAKPAMLPYLLTSGNFVVR